MVRLANCVVVWWGSLTGVLGHANCVLGQLTEAVHWPPPQVTKTSVEAARHNLLSNQVDNVFIARMSSEEFTETWKAKGSRRRLEGLKPWAELRLNTIFVGTVVHVIVTRSFVVHGK